ncbi:Imm50 family immunity protein [Hymenobacter koreensis]|uniref:Imm50 family immunity protein n=1 Tax=Hymenobacter koreensis TaxID=1084523 RepID=UPI0031ECA175
MAEVENHAISRILNGEIVRQHFGYWPKFHDAEITKVTFEANPGFWPSVTFVLTASEMTKEVDERGYYKQAKQCDVELQFTGVKEIDFDGFGHQNVIFELVLEEEGINIKGSFNPSVGLDAIIVAEKVSVLSLTPTNSRDASTSTA